MNKILIIDDDTYICNLLENFLKQKGYYAETAFTGDNGIKLFETHQFDLVFCDYRLPNSDGYQLLSKFKTIRPAVPVVIMTAYTDVKMAVKLIKAGAFDYITKPIQPGETLQLVKRAIELKKKKEADVDFDTGFVKGSSQAIQTVFQHVSVVAPTELTVLIEGETGSGKEYIARAIHKSSKRSQKNFVAVDCGALPKELANSELFGHIKGSFTGAVNDKKGYFEQAKGGTIFLDEVGNLPHENQVKLLRALQEKVISRVGDNKTVKTDVRLIAASNEDLWQKVNNNEFREDLYHRLNGFKIKIPALHERDNDVEEFTKFFIKQANREFGKEILGVSDEVMAFFKNYRWHGNIRELKNIVNRSVLLATGNKIDLSCLPDELINNSQNGGFATQQKGLVTELKEATNSTEKELIVNALKKSDYNKSKTARLLNIDRKTLYNKIEQYKIEIPG